MGGALSMRMIRCRPKRGLGKLLCRFSYLCWNLTNCIRLCLAVSISCCRRKASAMSNEAESGGGGWWGWIVPVSKILPKAVHEWAVRAYLRRCLEDPGWPEGRTLKFLTAAAGQPDTPAGQERTRELLRHITRGRKRARILIRSPGQPEMWGMRDD
jgi:hypothetical protein